MALATRVPSLRSPTYVPPAATHCLRLARPCSVRPPLELLPSGTSRTVRSVKAGVLSLTSAAVTGLRPRPQRSPST